METGAGVYVDTVWRAFSRVAGKGGTLRWQLGQEAEVEALGFCIWRRT